MTCSIFKKDKYFDAYCKYISLYHTKLIKLSCVLKEFGLISYKL